MDKKKLVHYLAKLSKNNNKQWFEANRAEYDDLRKQFTALVEDLIHLIQKFDKDFKVTDPKKCLFRLNRDIRFSKDKTPYKTHFSAHFGNNWNGVASPSYYLHIDHNGKLMIAGGLYMPDNNQLKLLRDSIVNRPEDFEDVIYDEKLVKTFGNLDSDMKLKRAPQGYDENSPMIEYLKLKSFSVGKEFNVGAVKGDLADFVAKHFEIMYPIVKWVNKVAK